jgi:uncharacterized phage-associated protein
VVDRLIHRKTYDRSIAPPFRASSRLSDYGAYYCNIDRGILLFGVLLTRNKNRARGIMSPTVIRFKYHIEKFIKAVAYLSYRGVPDLDRLKIAKLVYFADKYHLVEFGRPIIGDTYNALPYGPVPSRSLDIMEGACGADYSESQDSNVEKLLGSLEVFHEGKYPTFRAKSDVDFSDLSESEMEILDKVADEFGRKTGPQLIDITHKEKAWLETDENDAIDFRLMFDGPDEEYNRLRVELLEEDQEDREFFEFNR